jgi:hypothetical protein
MQKRAYDPTLAAFDRLQTRAFDALAKYAGNELIYNGRKARVISSPIGYEFIQEIVGYLPKRFANVEIKRVDYIKLGLANELYVAVDGAVLRIRQAPDDGADVTLKFYAHSTPNQPAASSQESGSINLAIGQVEVNLTFRQVDPKADYVFTELYIENTVDPAGALLDLDAMPGQRTAAGRKLQLNGAPDTANYVLRYTIKT